MQSWSFYVPPAQTVRDGQPLGIWFNALPSHTKLDVQNVFPSYLASILRSKYTGLLNNTTLTQIVQQHENGYLALYDILVHAGHPLLQAFPSTPIEPRQHGDCNLATYILNWITYCQHQALHGRHLSDRFFLQQFVRHLHPSLHSAISDYLEREVNNIYIHDPMPPSFGPESLFSKLLQRAQHLGRPTLVLQSPRDNSRSASLVREVVVSDSDDTLLLAALASTPSRACFICSSTEHLATTCPQLTTIRKDPFQRRMLLRLLDSSASSPSPHVRALQDTTPVDTPPDAPVIHALSSGEDAALASTASDFPLAR
jgi:hypothetical protein